MKYINDASSHIINYDIIYTIINIIFNNIRYNKYNNNKILLLNMGTRGFVVIIYRGRYYLIYNHYDSYPEGLGKSLIIQLIKLLDKYEYDNLKLKISNLEIVNDSITPTEDDINYLKEYTNLGVSTRSTNDWYCLLHRCQGSIIRTLEAGYIYCEDITSRDIYDSYIQKSWSEYNYILDFDNDTFSVNDIYVDHISTISDKTIDILLSINFD